MSPYIIVDKSDYCNVFEHSFIYLEYRLVITMIYLYVLDLLLYIYIYETKDNR